MRCITNYFTELIKILLNIYIKESQPRDAIRAGKATIIMPIEAVAAKSDVLTIKNYLKSTINY